jgi:hypothetical protein
VSSKNTSSDWQEIRQMTGKKSANQPAGNLPIETAGNPPNVYQWQFHHETRNESP